MGSGSRRLGGGATEICRVEFAEIRSMSRPVAIPVGARPLGMRDATTAASCDNISVEVFPARTARQATSRTAGDAIVDTALASSAIDDFGLRCLERGRHVKHGTMSLQQAVDAAQDQAVGAGLVDLLGQDAVQGIMAEAFQVNTAVEIVQCWEAEDRRRRQHERAQNVHVARDDWGPANKGEDYGIPIYAEPVRNEMLPILPSKQFVPVAIDDVALPEERPWLIRGILPARGLACIVGAPKSGKSFLATDMLCAVARGVPYAGRETTAGPVLYLTGEGVSGFKRRLIAMRRHNSIEGDGTPFYMIENVPDLGSDLTDLPHLIHDLDHFIALHAPGGVKAIVLDTLARCMGAGDENSARDMGRFVNRCTEIEKRYGCVVVVVHHVGKDPNRGGRGSNALNGAADVTMLVQKLAAFSRVRIEEMKDGAEGQEWRFRLVPYQLNETSETSTETAAETSTCVVELLSEPSQAKPPASKARKTPTGVAGDLLKVIRRAIEESGETNVGSLAVPNNTRAISRTDLKRCCATMAWQDQDGRPNAFRSMLSSNLSKLRSSDLIDFDKEWVWLKS
jgi:hypothetical protein